MLQERIKIFMSFVDHFFNTRLEVEAVSHHLLLVPQIHPEKDVFFIFRKVLSKISAFMFLIFHIS